MDTIYLNTLIKMVREDTPVKNINQHQIIDEAEEELNELKCKSRPVEAGVSNANGDKLVIAKEMCEKIIKHWETDKLYTKDPFSECYLLAKETLSRLSC